MEGCQLFMPAPDLRIVGTFRHGAAMLLTLAVIEVDVVTHVRPGLRHKRQLA